MYNPHQDILDRLERIESKISAQPVAGPDHSPIPKPLNIKQLCEFLDITEPTVLRWRKKGKIPSIQIGTAVRFILPDVIKALGK